MGNARYEIRRKCPICGCIFQIRTIDAIYCSKQCSNVAYKREKDRAAKEEKYNLIAKEIPDIKEYLSVREVVAKYCVERDTIYRIIRQGKIPTVNLGKKQIRIKQDYIVKHFQERKEAKEIAKKPIPKSYNLEPENCYTIGEISKKYRIHDTSVWTHIRKYSIPTRQIGIYVYAPKSEIDNLYKSIKK